MFYSAGVLGIVSANYSATLPIQMHLSILEQVMKIAVPLVGLLSVFLISYVNSYLFRRKQKEFAVESIIGMEQGTGEYQRGLGNFSPESAFVRLNTRQTHEGTSTMLMLGLIGAYAALVLLISSFTMLSVQQLTDMTEQKKRFEIIGRLGVEQSDINRNIRQQMYFWFRLPVLAALICSVGILAYLVCSSYKTIVAYISLGQIGLIFAVVCSFLTAIFCLCKCFRMKKR